MENIRSNFNTGFESSRSFYFICSIDSYRTDTSDRRLWPIITEYGRAIVEFRRELPNTHDRSSTLAIVVHSTGERRVEKSRELNFGNV